MRPSVRIEVCGPLTVTVDGVERQRAIRHQGRIALAFLALHCGRPVSREELIGAVWAHDGDGDHRAGLNTLVSRLRKALGADVVETSGQASLSLSVDTSVDYTDAVKSLDDAHKALQRSDLEAARSAAHRVVELADRGLMLGDNADWLEEWRRGLAELGVRARECLVEAGLAGGRPELQAATDRAREILRIEPFRDSACALLMRALVSQGNIADALGAYDEFRARLDAELGILPGPELRALHNDLLNAPEQPPPVKSFGVAPIRVASALPPSRSAARFVGREPEMDVLRAAFQSAAAGSSQVVLVAGQAGIGKTRLTTTFARECHSHGAISLYGRCDSQTLVPYQPFIEALRRHLSDVPIETLRERIPPAHLAELYRVLPELSDRPIPAARGSDGDDETERYRLFDAVAVMLRVVSSSRPALLILDDLHWADPPTLIMLRQIVRSVGEAPMLIIGTYREEEATEPLLDTLADLRREHMFERLALGGLNPQAAATLIDELSGHDTPAALTRVMWEESRGNPFFLEEMLRHGRDATHEPVVWSASNSVPEGIRAVIARRLVRLSKDVRRILDIACVAGDQFSIAVLEQLSNSADEALDDALQEAVDAHVIVELDYGRFAFEHSLTRQTLRNELTRTKEAHLHLRIGETLEELDDQPDGAQLAELAYHFVNAPPRRGLSKAVDYATQAGRHALEVLAYEEAVRHFDVALGALEQLGEEGPRRLDLLLALGRSHVKAGNTDKSRPLFREATDIARALHSGEGLANAALGLAAGQMSGGVVDAALIPLLEEALGALGGKHETLRARLLSRLAIELRFSDQHDRRAGVGEEAVAVARATGDAHALSAALLARHWSIWSADNLDERLQIDAELLDLASATGDPTIEMQGHRWRMIDLLESGDIAGVDLEIAAFAALARERRQPADQWYVHFYRAMRLLLVGSYEEAERESRCGHEIGQRVADTNAHQGFTLQMVALRRDLGGLEKVEDDVRANVARYPTIPGWRCMLAYVLNELGRQDESRTELEQLAVQRFGTIPRDGIWLGAIAYLAELVVALRERAHATTLYELLHPFADRNVTIGWSSSCTGSAARPLGQLAELLDRREAAALHFEQAMEMNEAMMAEPWLARTRVAYGRFLLDSGDASEFARSAELVQRGLAEARRLGMAPLIDRASSLLGAEALR